MDNKAMIITKRDINYSGEVLAGKFIDNGVIIKPSSKSETKVWIGINEIDTIIFPDDSVLESNEVDKLFRRLEDIKMKYSLKAD